MRQINANFLSTISSSVYLSLYNYSYHSLRRIFSQLYISHILYYSVLKIRQTKTELVMFYEGLVICHNRIAREIIRREMSK